MTMRSWLKRDFGVCAAVCLSATMLTPARAVAATHPVVHPKAQPHPAKSHAAEAHPHLTTSHAAPHRRAAAQEAPKPKPSAKSKGKSGHSTAAKPERKSPAHSTKPQPKGRHGKQRVEEPDNDPPILYRAHGKHPANPAATHPAAPHPAVASHRVVPAPLIAPPPEEETTAAASEPLPARTHDRRPLSRKLLEKAAAEGKGPVASAQPLRTANPAELAAKLAPTAEVFERGESHPDDDVRVDMTLPAVPVPPTRAVVSAAKEPITPAGKATLPEKLHSLAVKAETKIKTDATEAKASLTKHTAARPSILSEDPAERDAIIADAMVPTVLPNLYSHGGRLIIPPPMKGNHDILVHQNQMADKDGLDRIRDDADLNRMRAAHLLVALPSIDALEVNPDLPENRRYARPWTVRFVADIARAYYAHFGQPLRLSSAVRTVAYQLRLQRVNGNAAAVDGDGASPHLTGQAIDFGKHGMSIAQIAWMRTYLAPIMDSGKIDVEEEFQQACFHISVYRSYAPALKPKARPPAELNVAQTHAAPIVRAAARDTATDDEK